METTKNIRTTLSEEQIKILDTFREQIQDNLITEREKKWANDRCLCRYLRARDWDLTKSTKMILETIKWRKEYKPFLITAEDVKIELQNTGKMYRNGKDKTGRPIMYLRPGRDNTGMPHREVKLKYLVYLLEKCVEAMDEENGVEKIVWIVDWKGYSQLSGMSMSKLSVEVLDIVQNHYPERLGVAYLFNPPWIWNVFWKMISPFMTDITKSKVKMMNNKDLKPILEAIDPEELETEFGGNNPFKYNFEEHWLKDDTEFPIVNVEE